MTTNQIINDKEPRPYRVFFRWNRTDRWRLSYTTNTRPEIRWEDHPLGGEWRWSTDPEYRPED